MDDMVEGLTVDRPERHPLAASGAEGVVWVGDGELTFMTSVEEFDRLVAAGELRAWFDLCVANRNTTG